MGPCLFGLRVEADALGKSTDDAAVAHGAAILTIADYIARVNRTLLEDLRAGPWGICRKLLR